MKVLVVDDSQTVLAWVRSMLAPLGHVVHTARSGQEALAILDEQQVGLVMTDFVMPGMDGAELLKRVRARHDRLPVIVMSGVGSVEDAVELLRLGADEFLPKPIRQDELLACLERVAAKASVYAEARLFSSIVQEARKRPPIERLGELLAHFSKQHESPARAFSLEALDTLMRFEGPDAEFEALVEAGVRAASGPVVERADLDARSPSQPRPSAEQTSEGIPLFENAMNVVVSRFEKLYLQKLLLVAESREQALSHAGIDLHRLEELLRRHSMREPWHTPPPSPQTVPVSGDELLAPP